MTTDRSRCDHQHLSDRGDDHLPRVTYSHNNFATLCITPNIRGMRSFKIFVSLETISFATCFTKGKIRCTRSQRPRASGHTCFVLSRAIPSNVTSAPNMPEA